MTKVQVINKSHNPLPAYATELSAGMDVRADLSNPKKIKVFEGQITFTDKGIRLKPFARILIPTGLYFAIPKGKEIQVRSRSGKSLKEGLCVVQGIGTIDADYRGEVGICIINKSQEEQSIKFDERIAQLVLCDHDTVEWEVVDELSETERGAGGFGHSGKN
jgi:dUTP pyrophosphatase